MYLKDHEIIDLFFERSEQAVDELIVRYGTDIRRVAAGVLRDPDDVEECLNDTYLQIWNSIPPKRPQYLGAFACRIARNVALNRYHFNSARKRNTHYDAVLDELAGAIPAADTVESEWDAKELAECINRFLQGLSKKDRFLFMQRYWRGASVTQIAETEGMSAHAVSVRLFRIRRKLKKYLEKEGIVA